MKVRISKIDLEGMNWQYRGQSDFTSFVIDAEAEPVEEQEKICSGRNLYCTIELSKGKHDHRPLDEREPQLPEEIGDGVTEGLAPGAIVNDERLATRINQLIRYIKAKGI